MRDDSHGYTCAIKFRGDFHPARRPGGRPGICKSGHSTGYASTAAEVRKRLEAVLNDPHHLVLAAVSAGLVMGWAHAYMCCLVERDTFAELGGLVVDESARGRGVGGKLLAAVEEWARQNGCGVVSVRSNIIRHQAHKFYAAHGYQQIKTQHSFRKPL